MDGPASCTSCHQPQEYSYEVYPGPYAYYASEYQPMFWQALFTGLMGILMLLSMAGVAISVFRRGMRGEEVQMPF